MEGYRLFHHEADAGFEVFGRTMEELFRNGVLALFSLITDLATVKPSIEKRITVTGNGDIFINFLNDILFLWDTERFIPKSIEAKVSDEKAEITAWGEIFNPARHAIRQEVKAVTYHQFRIEEKQGVLKATVIVDM